MSDLLRRTLGEQIAVETVLAGGLWRTHVDPNQLESAILNLAVNARDAMPDGGKLTIETANTHLDEHYAARQAEVAPGQYVVIAVTDTGTGMAPRGHRAARSSRSSPPRTSARAPGSASPRSTASSSSPAATSRSTASSARARRSRSTCRGCAARTRQAGARRVRRARAAGDAAETILVVEDDDDVRAHSDADPGASSATACSRRRPASAALELLDAPARRSQLLFTDVGLPGGMNGRQLADEARRRRPGLTVLFTTGYARNAIVHDGRLDPGVQLITKPFTYAALAAKVRDMLDRNSAPPCILLVEDEALVRMVTVEALRELGFRVEEAASATEALAKVGLLAGRIDAAIVDIGLPDRRGDALAGELRAIFARLPIVIATGYGDRCRDGLGDEALTRFLGKPYDSAELTTILRDLGVRMPE